MTSFPLSLVASRHSSYHLRQENRSFFEPNQRSVIKESLKCPFSLPFPTLWWNSTSHGASCIRKNCTCAVTVMHAPEQTSAAFLHMCTFDGCARFWSRGRWAMHMTTDRIVHTRADPVPLLHICTFLVTVDFGGRQRDFLHMCNFDACLLFRSKKWDGYRKSVIITHSLGRGHLLFCTCAVFRSRSTLLEENTIFCTCALLMRASSFDQEKGNGYRRSDLPALIQTSPSPLLHMCSFQITTDFGGRQRNFLHMCTLGRVSLFRSKKRDGHRRNDHHTLSLTSPSPLLHMCTFCECTLFRLKVRPNVHRCTNRICTQSQSSPSWLAMHSVDSQRIAQYRKKLPFKK